jgi:hypothetical protein
MVAQTARTGPKRKHFPVWVSASFSGENPHRKYHFHSGETPTNGPVGKTPTTSILRGGGGGSGGCLSSEGCPPADGCPVLQPHDRQPFLDEIAAVIARELDKLA